MHLRAEDVASSREWLVGGRGVAAVVGGGLRGKGDYRTPVGLNTPQWEGVQQQREYDTSTQLQHSQRYVAFMFIIFLFLFVV